MVRNPQRGSLILVALCFVAVLGIALASYLAVSNNAMKLSNRSVQTGVSEQLAEMGLSEALRAFNANNWATWSANGTTFTWSTSGTTKTCTITLPATKYGSSGVTGSIKVRVDNYNAYNLSGSAWSSSSQSYQLGDVVSSSGMWYRCVAAHTSSATNGPPGLTYWVPAPIPWTWSTAKTYALYDVVNYNGTWYRCIQAGSGHTPGSGTAYWLSIPSISLSWSSSTTYARGALVFDSGAWYYSINGSNANNATSVTTAWAPVLPTSPAANTYATNDVFAIGDYIYRLGSLTWFRSLLAQTYLSGDYAIVSKWTSGSLPYISWMWNSSSTYAFNDLVYYSASGSGTWYRCKIASATTVPTTASDWETALVKSWDWNSGDSYNLNDVVYRGTSFYRCILAHTNHAPPNATYWSTAPLQPVAWDPAEQYNLNDTVSYNGIWYLSLSASNSGNVPPSGSSSTSYWATTADSAYKWSSATTYSTSSYVSYGGVWYHCILAPTTNQSPNNSTYWTALGAPVIYAQATATLPDSTSPIITELRATVATAPLFPNAVAATSTLIISGAGTVDSYDGSVYTMSSGGIYSTYTYNLATPNPPFSAASRNFGYSAVLAATGGTSPAVTVTTTTVKGYVAAPSASTTPFAPMWTHGAATLTGSAASGIDLTRVSRSPYIPQFDTQSVILHTSIPLTLPTTLNLGSPGATTPSVYTYASDLTLPASNVININGPVILDIQGSLNLWNAGTNVITIASTGSAEIHVSGRLLITAGNGINNLTKDPKKLILICTGNAGTSFYSTTTYPFYGTIYMPNNSASSLFTIDTGVVIYGAISAQNITFSSDANVHYDTSLRYATFHGVDVPYVISEWRQLTDPTEQVTLP